MSSISSELRGLEPREPYERTDAGLVSETERQQIEKIERIILDGRSDIVGSGRSADVILLDIWTPEKKGVTPWVIKQESRRTTEQNELNTTLKNEMVIQDRACRVIQAAQEKEPNKHFARIPKPLSLLEKAGKKWLIMEYIPGETAFERALRQVLLAYNEDEPQISKEKIFQMNKDDLVATLCEDEYRNLLPPRLLESLNHGGELDEQSFLFVALLANRATKGQSPVITGKQYEALKNTIDELHRNHIWHRDLHASNVQIEPDGSVAILDFGLATLRSENEIREGKNVYAIDLGNMMQEKTLRLPSDEGMLEQYDKISRKVR